MARQVTTSGTVTDTVVLFGMDAYQEFHPAIDFDGIRYLAVWHNYNYPPYGVYGRFLTTECLPEGREFPIRETTASFWCKPDCAFGFDQYFVVWNEMDAGVIDVYGQILTLEGFPVGDVIPIAEGDDMQLYPRIGVGDSSYLVVWEEEGLICGQMVSVSGALLGGNFVISDSLTCSRGRPGVSFAETGCLVVWMEFHADNYDIYGDGEFTTGVNVCEQSSFSAPCSPTIVRSVSVFRFDDNSRLYDITGRPVDIRYCTSGVYFIMGEGDQIQKVIVVR
ncbi:MAG: hypothetical protein JSW02_05265 [candidate division WOR-3 bacterium]|nr:MAG: hypothetical protein JSW02_05265 [candidate division WOR-3 bacterium]